MVRGQQVELDDALLTQLIDHHYGYSVHAIKRILNIPKVTTNHGIFGCKNANELQDLALIHHCLSHLKANGFYAIPSILLTKEHHIWFSYQNEHYYLETWFDAKDLVATDEPLAKKVGQTLASFHKASAGMHFPKKSERYLFGTFRKRLREVYHLIQAYKSKQKIVLELGYEREMLQFLENRCLYAYAHIEGISFSQLLKENPHCITFCHGSLHHGNVLQNKKGEICIIDIESAAYAERVYDLASFIHFYAPDHNWNPSFIASFIKGYQHSLKRPLSYEEWKLFFAHLAFPRRIFSWFYRYFQAESPSEFTYYKLLGILLADIKKEAFLQTFSPSDTKGWFHLMNELTKSI